MFGRLSLRVVKGSELLLLAVSVIRSCSGVPDEQLFSMSKDEGNSSIPSSKLVLFDFTSRADLSDWIEESDVTRQVGKSKAALTLQKTQLFQRAIFFSLLNPQANGACFAGSRVPVRWDLGKYKGFQVHCRGQGQNFRYKIVLRHRGEQGEPFNTYENTFQATPEFSTVSLAFLDFKPYFRGRLVNDTVDLDTHRISSFGFQIAGGVYLPTKQAGVSSLEIDWVHAVP